MKEILGASMRTNGLVFFATVAACLGGIERPALQASQATALSLAVDCEEGCESHLDVDHDIEIHKNFSRSC